MRIEDIRRAYDAVGPDDADKAAMLGNILAAVPSKEKTPPKRSRRWLLPALGAAAALVCVLSLPQGQPETPPDRPPVQGMVTSRPPVSAPAPELITWEGSAYRIDPSAPAPTPGQLLEQREGESLYTISGADPAEQLALVRGDAILLCRRAETNQPPEGET